VSAPLTSAVVSITATKRRRFYWAAWWTTPPTHTPFQKPDAAQGGARTRAEALAQAELAAGRHLSPISSYWARAYKNLLRGEPLGPPPDERKRRTQTTQVPPDSPWAVLGVAKDASPLAIRKAFRARALATHPDQGGDAEQFRRVMWAFERLTHKRRPRRRSRSSEK
jgi:hypothetical protein